ncbi:MAG: DUF3223 domain-containing protein [Lentisphaerae bacterium]|nr:DUF3223 domain-containing protein [Lentisphaerota bacterium]
MKPITIGGEMFPKKAAAEERCREMLARYTGMTIPPGPDRDFVAALLERHPGAAEKTARGVAGFTVVLEPATCGKRASHHFAVVCDDGTLVDFSFPKCLNGETPRSKGLAAMRHAIADQLAEARAAGCGLDGEVHAHHAGRSFRELAAEWLAVEGLSFETLVLACAADGIGSVMADLRQRSSWQRFHREHAVLVPMDAREHLRLPRGPREGAPNEKEAA